MLLLLLVACGGKKPLEHVDVQTALCPSPEELSGYGVGPVEAYVEIMDAGFEGLEQQDRYALLVDTLPRAILELEREAASNPAASWGLACAYARYANLGAELRPEDGLSRGERNDWWHMASQELYPKMRGVRVLARQHAEKASVLGGADGQRAAGIGALFSP